MNKKIEIVFIKGQHRQLGFVINEIKRVTAPVFRLASVQKEMQEIKNQSNFFTLKSFFSDEPDAFNSLVYIKSSGLDREMILGIPGEIEIYKIALSDIMILPGFLRNKQKPLFCWGFVRKENKLVMLVTLSKFMAAFSRNPIPWSGDPQGSR